MTAAAVRQFFKDTSSLWAAAGVVVAVATASAAWTNQRVEGVVGAIVSDSLIPIRVQTDRTVRGVQFLVCRDKRREEGKSLDYCEAYWDPQDFLPPTQARP